MRQAGTTKETQMLTKTQAAKFDQAIRTYTRPEQVAALTTYRRRTEWYMATSPDHTALLNRHVAACEDALRGMERVGIYDDILA